MSQHPTPKTKKKRRMRIVLFLVLGFCVWTGVTVYSQSQLLAEKEQQLQQLQREKEQATREQAELTYKVNRLQDEEYIAELARKHFYYSKPGEIIFVIPDK